MYAIVEIAGQQFKVAKDQKVYVHRLQGEEGSKVTFDNVLLLITVECNYWRPSYRRSCSNSQILKSLKR